MGDPARCDGTECQSAGAGAGNEIAVDVQRHIGLLVAVAVAVALPLASVDPTAFVAGVTVTP
jgi:hypothetical protein